MPNPDVDIQINEEISRPCVYVYNEELLSIQVLMMLCLFLTSCCEIVSEVYS